MQMPCTQDYRAVIAINYSYGILRLFKCWIKSPFDFGEKMLKNKIFNYLTIISMLFMSLIAIEQSKEEILLAREYFHQAVQKGDINTLRTLI